MEDTTGLNRPAGIVTPVLCGVLAIVLSTGVDVAYVVRAEAAEPGEPGEPAVASQRTSTKSAEVLVAAAREAAGDDRHEAAVAAALAAIVQEPERADALALFLGHQLTWADRPADAVPWYRRHLEEHPGDVEGQLGLARALSWVDDLDGAEEIYTRILREHPDELEARLGLARMQAWAGHDRRAAREYGRALEMRPSSPEAAVGRAAAESRLGRQRCAEELLVRSEAEHRGSTPILVELARARWWMGEGDRALATLPTVDDEACGDLRRAILRDRRWRFELSGSRWIDVDDQEVVRSAVRAEREHAHGLASVLEAARSVVDEPGTEAIDSYLLVAGGSWRPDRRGALNLRVTAENVGSGLSAADSLDAGSGEVRLGRDVQGWRLRWDTWATWTPRDLVRVDLGYGRLAVETPRARVRGVHSDVVSLGAERRWPERVAVRARVVRAAYSDGNMRVSVEGEAESSPYRITRRTNARIGAGALRYRFDDTPDHGYYSPSSYDAFFAAGGVEIRLGAGFAVAGDVRLSSEREESMDRFGVASGGGELRWDGRAPFAFSVFARKSTSRFDTSAGYGTRGIGATVRYVP